MLKIKSTFLSYRNKKQKEMLNFFNFDHYGSSGEHWNKPEIDSRNKRIKKRQEF